MVSDVMGGKAQEPSVSESDQIVSVLISNYPLSNGGYLVSFGQDDPEGSFKNYDPVLASTFEGSLLSKHLDCNPLFLPAGCFYLPDSGLASFIEALAFRASFFEMRLLQCNCTTNTYWLRIFRDISNSCNKMNFER